MSQTDEMQAHTSYVRVGTLVHRVYAFIISNPVIADSNGITRIFLPDTNSWSVIDIDTVTPFSVSEPIVHCLPQFVVGDLYQTNTGRLMYCIIDLDNTYLSTQDSSVWCRCDGCGCRIRVIDTIKPNGVFIDEWLLHKAQCDILQ